MSFDFSIDREVAIIAVIAYAVIRIAIALVGHI